MNKKKCMLLDKNNNFVLDNEGHYIDICDYKNCKLPVKKGWMVCEKHIGQNEKEQNTPKMKRKRYLQALDRFLGNPRMFITS